MLRPWFAIGQDKWVEGLAEIVRKMEHLSLELDHHRIRGDCYQRDGEVVVMVEIPDLKSRHEIDVRVEGQILTIRGTTGTTPKVAGPQEESAFVYEMLLPTRVEAAGMATRIDAADRVLTVRLPKT